MDLSATADELENALLRTVWSYHVFSTNPNHHAAVIDSRKRLRKAAAAAVKALRSVSHGT